MSAAPETPFSAGFSRVTVGDPATGERITAGIWYPTEAREAREQYDLAWARADSQTTTSCKCIPRT